MRRKEGGKEGRIGNPLFALLVSSICYSVNDIYILFNQYLPFEVQDKDKIHY